MSHDVVEGYRLSPQQERALRLQRNNAGCRTQCVLAIDGNLQVAALCAALQGIIDKHEILRTCYRSLPGVSMTVQVIIDHLPVPLREIDISSSDAKTQDELIRHFSEELGNIIDLERGAIVRAALFLLAADKYVLLLTFAPAYIDARSVELVLSELARAYDAQLKGDASPAGDVVQYADFAEWQNTLLESEEGRRGGAYWASLDDQAGAPMRLPFERDPTATAPVECLVLCCDELSSRIDTLAELNDLAWSDVLLACWQILLWRMTGQPDEVRVDVRFDGRKYTYLHQALGRFETNIPVICRLDRETTFAGLARQCQHAKSEAHRFQEFFHAAARSDGPDYMSRQRFGFVCEDWSPTYRADGLTFQVKKFSSCSDNTKLELVCRKTANSLSVEFNYDSSVYTRDGLEQMAEAFQTLLHSVTAEPEAKITRLPIVSNRLRHLLLEQWNNHPIENISRQCVNQVFEQQVERGPDAIAVVCGDDKVSYRALNLRANRLARRLRQLGVGPDCVVALLVDRSVEMIVALLGVLKAGAAYLPLEPTLPKKRLAHFLREAGATIVLAQTHLSPVLPDHEARVVVLEDEHDALAQLSGSNFESGATDANLAYVVFTSGSTGRPKGVAIEHRQLMNYINSISERLDLAETRSFATVSTLAADLGNSAVFPSLCSGSTLHIISEDLASDAAAFAAYFARHPCDCLKITPSHLAALAAATEVEHIFPRKRLILGGETLTWGNLRVFQSNAGGCRIFNHYGPTETTVGVAACNTEAEAGSDLSKTVPLGTPLLNSQIYILDDNFEPVPIGVLGEVFIGGANVGRGYINRPDLTAERFIPNPFAVSPGSRLYRTGDLARHLPNGMIEFVGRIDRQVKLRGYRIELGEIEILLRQYPGVREAVVVMSGEAEYQRLLAYIVSDGQTAPETTDGLHTYLAERLPGYMVPAHIILLDKLPLTRNGKLDHRALPAPEHILSKPSRTDVGPRTVVEEIIVGIFRTMLGIDTVGVDDDFFEIGGHSLLATRLLARVRDVFKTEISLRAVFEEPTVAGLGSAVEAQLMSEAVKAAGTREQPARQHSRTLSFVQKSIWDAIRTGSAPVPTVNLLLWLHEEVEVAGLQHALSGIVARHDILRARFSQIDSEAVQLTSDAISVALVIDETATVHQDSAKAAIIDRARVLAQQPFDILNGPLLRAHLLPAPSGQRALLLDLHPLVADTWSGWILQREVVELYRAWCAKTPCQLASPVLQYAEVTAWQSEPTFAAGLELQRTYWRDRLDGASGGAGSCQNGQREYTNGAGIARRSFLIEPETVAALIHVSAHHAVTLPITLLAAWRILLGSFLAQKDIFVAFETNGRKLRDTQDVVGPFGGMLLIRTDLSSDAALGEILEQVRDAVLGACANQDVLLEGTDRTALRAHAMLSVKTSRWDAEMSENILSGPVLELERDDETRDFNLALRVKETPQGFECNLACKGTSDLAADGIVDDWQALLDRIKSGRDANLYAPDFHLSTLTSPALH